MTANTAIQACHHDRPDCIMLEAMNHVLRLKPLPIGRMSQHFSLNVCEALSSTQRSRKNRSFESIDRNEVSVEVLTESEASLTLQRRLSASTGFKSSFSKNICLADSPLGLGASSILTILAVSTILGRLLEGREL